MAKVMDARLQTSRDQCPGRAADMSGAAGKHSNEARVEAARKLITNRAAVLNDVCNPERKTMHNIHEVVPAHLAGFVESGMKETARRLLGGSGNGNFSPSGPVEKEAAA